MAIITLYCAEAPGLTLGPESQIKFRDRYADVDTDEHPDWADWAFHPGTPFIRILEDGEAKSAEAAAEGVACPQCGKTFGTEKQLNGHLMSHRPRAPRA